MAHLDLDTRQTEILVSVLRDVLSDLSYEIANTDRQDYRETLKERREVLQGVARKLTGARETA